MINLTDENDSLNCVSVLAHHSSVTTVHNVRQRNIVLVFIIRYLVGVSQLSYHMILLLIRY